MLKRKMVNIEYYIPRLSSEIFLQHLESSDFSVFADTNARSDNHHFCFPQHEQLLISNLNNQRVSGFWERTGCFVVHTEKGILLYAFGIYLQNTTLYTHTHIHP